MKYRLNRALAATGACSRRRADEFIQAGRVRVNGKTVTDFNYEVDADKDKLSIDGESLSIKRFDYIMLNKPEGIVTTCNDEFGRRNVLDLLPPDLQHVRPVGRLDRDSSGLLLMTNDGDLAQTLAHPSHTVFKRYRIDVSGEISDAAVKQLEQGIKLDDGVTLPAKVRLLQKAHQISSLEISIREGRNRQIRRMCAKLGYPVQRLLRVAVGGLQLRQLQPGEWRRLTADEIQALRRPDDD